MIRHKILKARELNLDISSLGPGSFDKASENDDEESVLVTVLPDCKNRHNKVCVCVCGIEAEVGDRGVG